MEQPARCGVTEPVPHWSNVGARRLVNFVPPKQIDVERLREHLCSVTVTNPTATYSATSLLPRTGAFVEPAAAARRCCGERKPLERLEMRAVSPVLARPQRQLYDAQVGVSDGSRIRYDVTVSFPVVLLAGGAAAMGRNRQITRGD
jgi:hypothetical protein